MRQDKEQRMKSRKGGGVRLSALKWRRGGGFLTLLQKELGGKNGEEDVHSISSYCGARGVAPLLPAAKFPKFFPVRLN